MPISTILVDNYLSGSGIMKKSQIDDAQYNEWSEILSALFEYSRRLRKSTEWSSFSEAKRLPECAEIYELVPQAFDMIGNVNGYPLRRDGDLGALFVAYSSSSYADKDVQKLGSTSNRDVFTMRVEHYFARRILEQEAKSTTMLEDDSEDMRLVRRMKAKRRKMNKQKNENKNDGILSQYAPPLMNIEFTSFVVRCNSFKCSKNHDVDQIRALVDVMMPAGTIIHEEVPAGYCKDCATYFIFDSDYVRLREQGILLCQLVSQRKYEQREYSSPKDCLLKPESLLHQSGYNVNSSENLSSIQRQEILRRVIDSGFYSKTALLSFLDWLISRNEKVERKDMSSALLKWQADRKYVASYDLKAQKIVKVGKIIK